jgi:CRISPR-associated protein Csd1
MILQSLHDLYDRLASDEAYKIARPGYSLQKISFRVVIKPDGELFEIQDARIPSGKKLRSRQIMVPGTSKPSGQGLNPCLLWDNTGYMLGYKPDDKKPERSAKTFVAFRDRHLDVESKIDSTPFTAVCRFLESWDPEQAGDHPILEEFATGFGVFRILGEPADVHEDAVVRRWWDSQLGDSNDGPQGQCLITGATGAISRLHPKIKGVAGGKSEALLVSFNDSAYESYGKDQSYNSPVSPTAGFRYGTALNALLDGPMSNKHRFIIGDTTVAFWTDRPTATEDIFARFTSEGSIALESEDAQDEVSRRKVELFLTALRKGREAYGDLDESPDQTTFYILGLSSNAARVSVRFFHHCMLSDLLDNLRLHHQHIGLKPQPASGKRKGDPEFPPNWMLLRQTGRESKDIPPILSAPLLRAVIMGTRYPEALYQAIVRRMHADRTINYIRACAIKGYLVRNRNMEVSMSLDTERKDPAYRLGRLFAAMEKTQKDALPGISATIRERFYSSASATPGSVFPRLLRTYQHHIAKLEGGIKVNREKLLQEIMGPLEEFPAHLGLSAQGLFAIGYYHQTQAFYTKKQD